MTSLVTAAEKYPVVEDVIRPTAKGALASYSGGEIPSGTLVTFTLPKVTSPTLFHGDYSYIIKVPAGATRLEVRLASLNADVDLYVRQGEDVALANGGPVADFKSANQGGSESIVISGPALKAGSYYIAAGLFTMDVDALCVLSATYSAVLPTNTISGAHFVVGDGWSTSLVLTNISTASETFTVRAFGDNGSAMDDPFARGTQAPVTGTLGPGASQTIDTQTAPTLRTGWAAVIPGTANTQRITGFAVFRYRHAGQNDYEAVVPLSSTFGHRTVMPFDNSNGFQTGVAVMNPNEFASITVQVRVRDENGTSAESYSINLPPLGHTAVVLSSGYPGTANRRGTLMLTSSDSSFGVLGLRFNPSGPFTSFPASIIE
jgi:hypothetical protein